MRLSEAELMKMQHEGSGVWLRLLEAAEALLRLERNAPSSDEWRTLSQLKQAVDAVNRASGES